ncbi:MAG TPA: VTT domain-containing protein [Terriglobia bacterium]|nr:VTT domain-containing protein [Terriglobia bacterium]
MRYWTVVTFIFIAFAILMNLIFVAVLHVSLVDEVKPFLTEPGAVSALVIVALLASDIFLPIPSTVVMVLGGVLFGTVTGAVLALVGSILGNWLGFELMYRYGAAMSGRFVSEDEVQRMQPVLDRFGSVAVIVSRPVPIMMETLSFLSGLARMPRSRFLLASLVGTIPICALYSYAGAAAMEMKSVMPALFALVCLPAAGWLFAQRRLAGVRGAEVPNR